ncbi:MAG: AbiTii domain-containing protein [Telluria sp.]
MKLLVEIVALLSDQKGSLTDALLKTKVLMHAIGHKELAEWVNDELSGYPSGKPVPSYRVVGSRVVGTLQSVVMIYHDQTLPTGHLSEKIRKYLHEHEMRDSISVLEQYAADPDKHLMTPVQPELYASIGEALSSGIWVSNAWMQMEPTQIMHALTEIRSRLLDFALELRDKLGDINEPEAKEAAKDIDAPAMFAHAVFGDNAVIVVGDRNTTTVRNVVKKGDFASLAHVLKSKGVADVDIGALQAAIEEDQAAPEPVQSGFGSAVKNWMSRMMSKAIEASWQIELGIAGNLLTDALKSYYFG